MVEGDPPELQGLLGGHPLYRIIRRLMARRPEDRYVTAPAALADLDALDPADERLWF